MAALAGGECLAEGCDLAVGAGAGGEDAAGVRDLGRAAEMLRVLADGTSAHRQIATFRAALAAGQSRQAALEAVVDLLIEETVAGL